VHVIFFAFAFRPLQLVTTNVSRARPSPELLDRLRDDKRRLHAAARTLSLPEKVRRVIELQRIVLPQIARRRPLRRHEVAWDERSVPVRRE
jgi:hypothetical protein